MVAIALLIAVELLYLVASGQLGAMGGLEMADIAERLVAGVGFSSPYLPVGEGGATSVSPPLYVWLMSIVYRILGVKTVASHGFLQCLNIVFNVVTLVLLFRTCQKLTNETTARVFAILFALHPHILLIAGSIWETGLSLMLLSTILWLVTTHTTRMHIPTLIALGLLFGLTALSNPAWTICYPLICLVILWPDLSRRQDCIKSIVALAVVVMSYLCVVSPWLLRNYETTGNIMYVRNMAGPELYKGNHEYAGGGHGFGFNDYWIYKSEEQRNLYRTLGETNYDQIMKQTSLEYIQTHPGHYIELILKRVIMWWSGDFDALNKWYAVADNKKLIFGIVLTIAGVLTSFFTLYGTWSLRNQARRFWLVWIYIYFLPIPYYLIIVGFRYQSSLIAFSLIPAAYCIARAIEKTTSSVPIQSNLTDHATTDPTYPAR